MAHHLLVREIGYLCILTIYYNVVLFNLSHFFSGTYNTVESKEQNEAEDNSKGKLLTLNNLQSQIFEIK